MQPGRLLAGMAVILAIAWGAVAQPTSSAPTTPHQEEPPKVKYLARVRLPEAEVRCKPSADKQCYATNKLRQNDTVQVVDELPDNWLAILPPPGSFSWINKLLVASDDNRTWRVVTDQDSTVQVLCGSSVYRDKPTAISAEVKRGTQLVSVGKPQADKDGGGLLLPIEPPVRELRYIRAEAVIPNNSAGQTPSPPLAQPSGAPSRTTAALTSARSGSTGTAPAQIDHPLWQRAQLAEQQGNATEAIHLYDQLGRTVRETDHNLAMKAHLQAQNLRDRGRSPLPTPDGYRAAVPPTDGRLQPVASGTSSSVRLSTCVPCQTTASGQGMHYRSLPGRLRQSSRQLEGPTYALEDAQGRLLMYVTPQSGVDLRPYLYQVVEVIGPLSYRGDLRTYHMQATQVTSVR